MTLCQEEERRTRYTVLDMKVLAVAREGGNHDWAAYIGAVPGWSHDEEWRLVYENGSKLPREVAELLFPDFTDLTWRW